VNAVCIARRESKSLAGPIAARLQKCYISAESAGRQTPVGAAERCRSTEFHWQSTRSRHVKVSITSHNNINITQTASQLSRRPRPPAEHIVQRAVFVERRSPCTCRPICCDVLGARQQRFFTVSKLTLCSVGLYLSKSKTKFNDTTINVSNIVRLPLFLST